MKVFILLCVLGLILPLYSAQGTVYSMKGSTVYMPSVGLQAIVSMNNYNISNYVIRPKFHYGISTLVFYSDKVLLFMECGLK